MSAVSIGTSPSTNQLPKWADTALATIVLTLLFAVLPTYARLQFRRLLWRRRSRGVVIKKDEVEAERLDLREPEDFPSDRDASPPVSEAAQIRPKDPPARAQRPVAPTVLLGEEVVAQSKSLRAARDLQYPVARAARGVQAANGPKEQYEAILDVADSLITSLGASSAAWLRSVSPTDPALISLREAFDRGVTQGSWQEVTRRASHYARDAGAGPPGLAEAVVGKKKRLLPSLALLTSERNLWAHGGAPKSPIDAAERVPRLLPSLETALDEAAFMLETPWVISKSSSYDSRERSFTIRCLTAMADHPEFERRQLVSSVPVSDNHVHALSTDNFIDLSPLVVVRDCEVCRVAELFYADKLTRDSRVALKSFGNGHKIIEGELEADLRTLGLDG